MLFSALAQERAALRIFIVMLTHRQMLSVLFPVNGSECRNSWLPKVLRISDRGVFSTNQNILNPFL